MTASIFQGEHPIGVQANLIQDMKTACAVTVSVGGDWINIHCNNPEEMILLGEEIARQARQLARDLLAQEEAA